MACTLDFYTNYLLSSTGQTSATGLSRLFDGHIGHGQVKRWLTRAYSDSRQMWAHVKPLIRQTERALAADDFAVLVVDDSILEKAHVDANALLCTHYDHCLERYVKGLNFVNLLYVAGPASMPIAVELVEKTQAVTDPKMLKVNYKSSLTKNETHQAMLRVALPGWLQQQVAYRYLLADSWYASVENIALVRELSHPFIFPLPTSGTVAQNKVAQNKVAQNKVAQNKVAQNKVAQNKVAQNKVAQNKTARATGVFQVLDMVCFPDGQPPCVLGCGVAVLVIRQVFTYKDGTQGVLYLVSNDTELSWKQVNVIFQKRGK